MRALLFFSFIVFCFGSTNAQNIFNSKVAQTVAYWEVRDTHKMKVTEKKIRITEGKKTESSATSNISIAILESTDTSYTVDWSITSDMPPPESLNEVQAALFNITKSFHVKMLTSETGSYKGILNMEELMEQADSMIDIAIGSKESSKSNDSIKKMVKMILTPRVYEFALGKFYNSYYMFFGYEFNVGESNSQTVSLTNPWVPGSTILSDISYTLVSVDEKEGIANFSHTQNLKKEEVRKVIDGLASRVNRDDLSSEFENLDIKFDREVTQKLNLRSTFPEEIQYKQVIQTDANNRTVEIISFIQVQ